MWTYVICCTMHVEPLASQESCHLESEFLMRCYFLSTANFSPMFRIIFVHIFTVKQSTRIVLALPYCFEESVAAFRMPVTSYDSTQHNIPKDFSPEQYVSESRNIGARCHESGKDSMYHN